MSEIQVAHVVPAARAAASWWAERWNESLLRLGGGDLELMRELMVLVEEYHGVTEEQRERFEAALSEIIDERLSAGNLQICVELEADEILMQAAQAVPEVHTSAATSFPVKTKMIVTCDEVLVKDSAAGGYVQLELR